MLFSTQSAAAAAIDIDIDALSTISSAKQAICIVFQKKQKEPL
jgi:hypothetical protein